MTLDETCLTERHQCAPSVITQRSSCHCTTFIRAINKSCYFSDGATDLSISNMTGFGGTCYQSTRSSAATAEQWLSIVPLLQAAETRNTFVGYLNPVCRARDSAKILRLRLIHHRQKIPICRWRMHSPILPLDPPRWHTWGMVWSLEQYYYKRWRLAAWLIG